MRPTLAHRRSVSRSFAAWSSGAALFAVVAALTAGVQAHALSTRPFASSAARIAGGKLWLLLSSALVIERPVAIGLVTFGLIASAVLWVCGARTFWLTAVAGHVGSTVVVYAIVGLSRLADPHLFSGAVVSPDFGVSAMQGAWVGALTAHTWMRSRPGLRPRAATAAAVCGLAGVAWHLHPDPSVLTTEHVFAFLIGGSIVWSGSRRVRRPVLFATTSWRAPSDLVVSALAGPETVAACPPINTTSRPASSARSSARSSG
jgi:hypothetical protein